jgi:hypothetical protein
MSQEFDVILTDLVEGYAGDLAAFFGQGQVRSVRVIDADLATLSAAADKVLRVQGDSGEWLLHIEWQSRHELELPHRVHLYNTLLHYHHRLPVRSVVVVLRREANASSLTGLRQVQLPDEATPCDVFRYHVVRLWQLPLESFLAGGVGLLPLAPLTDEAEAILPAVIGRIDERLRGELPPEKAEPLRTATFFLMGLRYADELVAQLFRGVITMEDSSTYQMVVSKGKVLEARKLLLLMGHKRFGPPDEPTVATVNSITDLGRLEQLSQRLLDVSTWQEFLAEPPA